MLVLHEPWTTAQTPKLRSLALRQLHRSDARESAALQKLLGDYPKTITRHLVSPASQACGRESFNYFKKLPRPIHSPHTHTPIVTTVPIFSFVQNHGAHQGCIYMPGTALRCIIIIGAGKNCLYIVQSFLVALDGYEAEHSTQFLKWAWYSAPGFEAALVS